LAPTSAITGSGILKVSPYVELKRSAMFRVSSTCCFWSAPTGIAIGLYSRMSAAISSGYVKIPTFTFWPFTMALSLYCVILSSSDIRMIVEKIHESSACSWTADCWNRMFLSVSIPAAM